MANDRLELRWIGKDVAARPEPRVLVGDPLLSHRVGPADGSNLLIKGDNLLALKALEADYESKVVCAFIDPPYNTGTAFDHYDDGLEHSYWLSLIRERIKLIHKLLDNERGSLWISIDDNEAHYLKVLCDEIFCRRNFVSNVVWQKKYTIANDSRYLSDNHDHILIYAKNKEAWVPNRLPRSDEMNARYSNPDGHPKGPWKATPLHAKSVPGGGVTSDGSGAAREARLSMWRRSERAA